ncbi:MAG: hypothetical protein CMF60_01375 [Magnetococcales bacterium]|nr:hypothetical protein [Magnetococcales bacterium]|tara:strand:- start:3036 stop:3353 length:318 start_codon:yes stop_codon:yes gene_type:complete
MAGSVFRRLSGTEAHAPCLLEAAVKSTLSNPWFGFCPVNFPTFAFCKGKSPCLIHKKTPKGVVFINGGQCGIDGVAIYVVSNPLANLAVASFGVFSSHLEYLCKK